MDRFDELPSLSPMNGSASLYLMMGEVREKIVGLDDRFGDLQTEVRSALHMGHKRMDHHERQIRMLSQRKPLLAVAREIASLKEWLIGMIIVIMALKGIISPSEIKALILSPLTPL